MAELARTDPAALVNGAAEFTVSDAVQSAPGLFSALNLGKRLVKTPKLHLIDAGLTAHLRGQADAAALALSPQLGPLLETFAVQEMRRHLRWAGGGGRQSS